MKVYELVGILKHIDQNANIEIDMRVDVKPESSKSSCPSVANPRIIHRNGKTILFDGIGGIQIGPVTMMDRIFGAYSKSRRNNGRV